MNAPTLLHAWNRTARSAPDAPALTDAHSSRVWSRGELDALADAWLAAHGAAAAGQTVAFAEPNGVEWLRVFLGLLKSGGVAVPLDSGEPPLARRTVAEAAGATSLWAAGGLDTLGPRRPCPRDGRRLVKLTSGSTGTPRAIVFTDAQMLADGRQTCASMGISRADVNFALVPFGHSYGLGNLVIPLLARGTAIVAGAAALPHAIAADVARWRPTVFPAVPALLSALAESDIDPGDLGSLRIVISAGAPLAPDAARRFHARFGMKIHNFYGSSETGGIAYDRRGDATLAGRGVGAALRGVKLSFARGRRLSVASAAVFTIGNRRREGAIGRHLLADLAEENSHGEVALLGRVGSFVKIAGRRLNPAEVERALRQVPGVRDAFATPDAGRPETLAAAVATSLSAPELRAALRDRLAPWKIPRRLLVLDTLPVTARGKTDTRRLAALLSGC